MAAPIVAGQATIGAYKKIKPYLSELIKNVNDRGIIGGVRGTFTDAAEIARNNRGFVLVLDQLESAGSIDTPEQLEQLIKKTLNLQQPLMALSKLRGKLQRTPPFKLWKPPWHGTLKVLVKHKKQQENKK